MMKKSNAVKSLFTLSGVVLGLVAIFSVVFVAPEVLGQSKSATVSIIKGASNPSTTEPYNPSPLTVHVGTTVTWTNNDNTGHTVTEGNPSGNTPANGFDSGILAPEKTFTHTFATAGTIQYYCTLHPTMLGEVIVK